MARREQDNKESAAFPVAKSDAEWKKILTPEQYRVMRQKGTERPFSGEYVTCDTKGIYRCAACGQELFSSDAKFDSHCGWPSFSEPAAKNSLLFEDDRSLGMERVEVICSGCGAHLGHVFDDGPAPTHKRFCINSVALDLEEEK